MRQTLFGKSGRCTLVYLRVCSAGSLWKWAPAQAVAFMIQFWEEWRGSWASAAITKLNKSKCKTGTLFVHEGRNSRTQTRICCVCVKSAGRLQGVGVSEQRGAWGAAMGVRVFLPCTFYHHFVFCTDVNMPTIQKLFYFNNEMEDKNQRSNYIYKRLWIGEIAIFLSK